MRNNTVINDYAEFEVTFEKYEESKNELKAEIKKMTQQNYSNEEINEALENGIKALTIMAFNLKKESDMELALIDIRILTKTGKELINTRQHVK